jgi:hypothetical protein
MRKSNPPIQTLRSRAMKFSDIAARNLIAVNRADAAAMVGGTTVLDELIKQGLRPTIRRHKLTVFDVNRLKAAWDALQSNADVQDGAALDN